jgi:hypothetical protein
MNARATLPYGRTVKENGGGTVIFRATQEILKWYWESDNACTMGTKVSRDINFDDISRQSQSQSHFATDSQSVCLFWCRAPSGAHDQIFILIDSYSPVHMGRPL